MSALRRAATLLTALSVSTALLALAPAPGHAAPDRAAAAHAVPAQVSREHAAGASPGARARASDPVVEMARVDAVPTPHLRWKPCAEYQCATVRLPLDYDHPRGRTVEVALLKVPAADRARRIGSLFLNPGGPGGSGKGIAQRAVGFLSADVLDRFDLIGVDPRGTNDSTRVQCYPGEQQQAEDTGVLGMVFPTGRAEEAAFRRAAGHLATRCSTFGQPLSSSMSTTEVARDLDVLRRAVGDRKLTYLGWSYGTYLGQVYANMFPGRVRALAIDGVIDPVAWQGTPATSDLPLTFRMNSAAGADRALSTLLTRCRQAGEPRCPLMPDPAGAFEEVANALRREPVTLTDEEGTYQITYAGFVHDVLLALYQPEALEDVPAIVAMVRLLISEQTSTTVRQRAASRYGLLLQRAAQRRELAPVTGKADPTPQQLANDYELSAAVACSDTRNPWSSRSWVELGDRADRQSPYFGRLQLWSSAWCARSHWTAFDEDAYRGPFDRRTSTPVLVVGNSYDPATNYDSAVAVARRLPGSRLLSSDSWGHTAYGTSGCVTSAVDAYLIGQHLPAKGIRCVGDFQPYEGEAGR